jgi:hypothetical protein
MAVSAGVIVVVAIVALTVYATSRNEIPSADSDPLTLAKFVTTEQFEDLLEVQKRAYMRTLRLHADQLTGALKEGKLTRDEYEQARHNIWLERQFDKMDDYFKLPPGAARMNYLDELMQSKIEKRRNPKPRDPNEPATDDDSPFMEERKSHWPSDLKARWKEFRNALDQREKLRGL